MSQEMNANEVALNRERVKLIRQSVYGTLTEAEAARLQELQTWVGEWLDKNCPLPEVLV